MLLTEPFFKTFTSKQVADTGQATEVILALSTDNREEVDLLVEKAFAAGATRHNEPQDFGWMYQHGFQDLDGHLWEVFYMDPTAVPQQEAAHQN
jgi:predicted lactoylglutathione lyase